MAAQMQIGPFAFDVPAPGAVGHLFIIGFRRVARHVDEGRIEGHQILDSGHDLRGRAASFGGNNLVRNQRLGGVVQKFRYFHTADAFR